MAELYARKASINKLPGPALDMLVDIDDMLDEEGSEIKTASSKKILFAKSTDTRRRIEEKLEVKYLRDELGMDDLDLNF